MGSRDVPVRPNSRPVPHTLSLITKERSIVQGRKDHIKASS